MFEDRRTRKHGLPAQATVISVDERSHLTSNELRDYDHVLEVRPPDRPPFRAEVREKLWIAGLRPKEGDVLDVRYDPDSLHVVFDFDGDPRYDLEALEAQNADRRRTLAATTQRMGGPAPPPSEWPVPKAAPAPLDPIARLERLVRLRDAGALTAEEFEAQKRRVMGTT